MDSLWFLVVTSSCNIASGGFQSLPLVFWEPAALPSGRRHPSGIATASAKTTQQRAYRIISVTSEYGR